jgi:hypothetical protein
MRINQVSLPGKLTSVHSRCKIFISILILIAVISSMQLLTGTITILQISTSGTTTPTNNKQQLIEPQETVAPITILPNTVHQLDPEEQKQSQQQSQQQQQQLEVLEEQQQQSQQQIDDNNIEPPPPPGPVPDSSVQPPPSQNQPIKLRKTYKDAPLRRFFSSPRYEILHSDPEVIRFIDTTRLPKYLIQQLLEDNPEKSKAFDHVTTEFSEFRDEVNAITDAIYSTEKYSLPHPRFEMTINVITYNRPKSLQRLCDSLSAAHYYGHRINIRFYVDHGADETTVQLVKRFNWPHGPKSMHFRHEKSGLIMAILESWFPTHAHDYVMLAEDDIEVSPYWYSWVLKTMKEYRYASIDPETKKVVHSNPQIIGISLYTPRECEMAIPRFQMYPDQVFTQPVYLHQIPCSWGAVYFPEHWIYFRQYVYHRLDLNKNVYIPNCECNGWTASWVKYYVELLFMKGWSMLYPNFKDQVSFSTNHMEPGVHIKEDDSLHARDAFTVPLALKDEIPDQFPPVQELPIVDYKCFRTNNGSELIQVGDPTWHKYLIELRRKENPLPPKVHTPRAQKPSTQQQVPVMQKEPPAEKPTSPLTLEERLRELALKKQMVLEQRKHLHQTKIT